MNILVTGSSGQLGTAIQQLATAHSNLNLVFTDVDTLDITNPVEVEQIISRTDADVIINCAAYTAVDKAEEEEPAAKLINANGPLNLAAACEKAGARLIHISTDYVFDGAANKPYSEADTPNPKSVYGKSKLLGEQNILANCNNSLIIRTSWLYSPFGNNFVKTIMRAASQRDKLTVVFDQTGTPTYAFDLASLILIICAKVNANSKFWVPGVYHYSNEGVCSWYDFAIEILKAANIKCEVVPVLSSVYPQIAQRPTYSVFDKGKIKDTFEIKIPYWKDSLCECIKILNNS